MTGASLGYSGGYNNISLNVIGERGHWWSATIQKSDYSYNFNVYDTGFVGLRSNVLKNIGRAVRCI